MMARFHSLEEYDGDHWRDEGVSPYSSGLWGVAQATRAAVARKALSTLERMPFASTLGSMDVCWCGEPRNHDWPGKTEGERHPR